MKQCYAGSLGDCAGPLELEHYVPRGIQSMLGEVKVSGLSWQAGREHDLRPGSYALSRIICEKHHNELDGLDGVALAYFRNFNHVASRAFTGTQLNPTKFAATIDGRALERWLLKTICGAIAVEGLQGFSEVPSNWVRVLFQRVAWPDGWALYLAQGTWEPKRSEVGMRISFSWSDARELQGICVDAFSFHTILSLLPPDGPTASDLLMRPTQLRVAVKIPSDAVAPDPFTLAITWP